MPAAPSLRPTLTSGQLIASRRSMTGPLPRSLVIRIATSAASAVGTTVPISAVSIGIGAFGSGGPGARIAARKTAESNNTASTNRNAPNPHR